MENPIQGLYGLKLFLASEPVQKVLSEGCQLFQRKMEQLQTAPLLGLQSNSLAPSSSGHKCSAVPLGLAKETLLDIRQEILITLSDVLPEKLHSYLCLCSKPHS